MNIERTTYDEDSIYAEHMEWIENDEFAPSDGYFAWGNFFVPDEPSVPGADGKGESGS